MTIDPSPAGKHDFLDPEGNCATCLWFEEQVSTLTVLTSFDAQTYGINPFGYLVTDDSFFQLPVQYAQKDAVSLASFQAIIDPTNTVEMFTRSIRDKSKGKTIEFLFQLCTEIYENFRVETRLKGEPHLPGVTIESKRGACRDLALLYVAACRNVGLAARFVSGYQEGDAGMKHPHLHAWAEVYIPGGGWRGYDPTHGLAVADRHVVLAASRDPAGAAPVTGTYRGTGVTAKMDYQLSLARIPDDNGVSR